MHDTGLCIFGEVLFDDFTDGNRVLGGAPFNVAWHLQAFGQAPRFISRVGNDPLGVSIREAMDDWGMDTALLQYDDEQPTGTVRVVIEEGEPSYEIVAERAYDFIAPLKIVGDNPCGLLYHGTLALRNSTSRRALADVKRNLDGRIFMDVNLRDPWWNRERVVDCLGDARWVKLSEQELRTLHSDKSDIPKAAHSFLAEHGLEFVVVTRGADGAIAVDARNDPVEVAPADQFKLVDTVGAGDAFAAVLLLGLINEWPVRLTMERAQSFASALVGQQGATVRNGDFYRPFTESWNLP